MRSMDVLVRPSIMHQAAFRRLPQSPPRVHVADNRQLAKTLESTDEDVRRTFLFGQHATRTPSPELRQQITP